MNLKNLHNRHISLSQISKFRAQYVRYCLLSFACVPRTVSNYVSFVVCAMSIFLLSTSIAIAASSSGLVNGIWFSNDPVTNYGETIVFSVIHNQTDEKLQGIATLVIDGEAVSAQEVSVNKGDIYKVGIASTFSPGTHHVSMSFTAGSGAQVTLTELAAESIFVVTDTDGDGIRNATDLDDDNDGIPDSEDVEPLIKNTIPKPVKDLSDSGRSFLAKVIGRDGEEKSDEEATKEDAESKNTATSTIALIDALLRLENARKRGAETLRVYEEARRAKIEEIVLLEEESLAVSEDFEPTDAEKSKKREHQIAAAGAATFGTMLEKAWVFYAEIIVLSLGVLHLLWAWFKRRFRNVGSEEGEDE